MKVLKQPKPWANVKVVCKCDAELEVEFDDLYCINESTDIRGDVVNTAYAANCVACQSQLSIDKKFVPIHLRSKVRDNRSHGSAWDR